MCIKATLQIEFTNSFGERDGLILYKVTLAQIIEILCSYSLESELSSEIKLQAIKKLAKRIKKLSLLKTNNQFCQKSIAFITVKLGQ